MNNIVQPQRATQSGRFRPQLRPSLVGLIFALSIALTAVSARQVVAAPPVGYSLVWSDEFNQGVGSLADPSHWFYLTGTPGASNGELETYVEDVTHGADVADPNATDGDAFQIEATNTGGVYQSSRLGSAGLTQFQYGFIEARIRLPYGQGIWPAFWMLGSNYGSVGWPACGEIDIMENLGKQSEWGINHSSLHGPGYSGGNPLTATYTLPNGEYFKDGYHLFQALWLPNSIAFYVDGNLFETHSYQDTNGNPWPYNQPFNFIVNLAVGGGFPGNPDGTTVFPQNMLVDYVRVYQSSSAPIAAGNYTLTPSVNAASCLDAAASGTANGTKVQIWHATNTPNQTWNFTKLVGSPSLYQIQPSYDPNLSLDVYTAASANGTLVDLWANNGTAAQQWNVISNLNGTFKLTPASAPGMMLDVASAGTTDGTQVDIYGDNGTAAQTWTLTAAIPPSTPSGLTANAANAAVNLSWSPSATATSYNVYRGTAPGGEGAVPIASGIVGNTYTDSGLTNGVAYYYTVAALNVFGTSSSSAEAAATPRASILSITDNLNDWTIISAKSANWTLDTSNPGFFNGDVSRAARTVSDTEYLVYSLANIASFNAVVYTFSDAISAATFWYSTNKGVSYTQTVVNVGVKTPATNWGCADISNAGPLPAGVTNVMVQFSGAGNAWEPQLAQIGFTYVPVIPSAPTGLTATASNNSIALSWTGSAGAVSYNIYRGTASRGEGRSPIASAITTTTYDDTTAVSGVTYYYDVAAVNAAGMSTCSGEAHATASTGASAPPAPVGLTATAGSMLVALSWTSSTGATSYCVYRGTTAGGESSTAVAAGITTTSYTDIGLTNAVTYYYKVMAVDVAGTSAPSMEASATPTASVSAPAAPKNVTASGGSTQISLAWSASVGATSYSIYRGSASRGEGRTPIATGISATSYTNTGLTDGTAYWYVLTAVNSTGTSPNSAEASAITQASSSLAAPGNVAATAGDESVTVSWSAVSGATSYNVYQRSGSTFRLVSGTMGLAYTATRLANGTTYTFEVAAAALGKTSPNSVPESATPSAVAISAGPSVTVSGTTATVTWTTNMASQSAVNYGTTTTLGTTVSSTTPVTLHSIQIIGLTKGTTYDYSVSSTDGTTTAKSVVASFTL